MLGEYGLGMKLYALHRQCAMAHTHDLTIVGPGGDFKLWGQRSAFYGQRVVSVDRISLRQVSENPLLSGVYDAGFAVHQLLDSDDAPAESRTNALVPQTHAEYG